MRKRLAGRGLALLLTLVPVFAPAAGKMPLPVESKRPVPVSREELLDELRDPPRGPYNRAMRMEELFRQAGLRDVREQDIINDKRLGFVARLPSHRRFNIIATLPGQTEEVILVGAHMDYVHAGRGILDNWSGASMMANLAQALATAPRRHTFVFVAFDLEEYGLYGSRHYVSQMTQDDRDRLRAMVNLDCLGEEHLMVWNGPSVQLEALARRTGERMGLDVRRGSMPGYSGDSVSFVTRDLPAIWFLTNDPAYYRRIHTRRDTFDGIDPDDYERQYRFVLEFLQALDRYEGPVNTLRHRAGPWLGVVLADEAPARDALTIERVAEDSPAWRAGMRPGDRILRFDGQDVAGRRDLGLALRDRRAGERVAVTVDRRGTEQTLQVQLE